MNAYAAGDRPGHTLINRADLQAFRVCGPALISFSGGRSSTRMLRMILDGHGGKLPDDVHVCFANTGKELPETLEFVRRCGAEWGVPIHWLEYRGGTGSKAQPVQFAEVNYTNASRAGEPFDLLVEGKGALPNWQARWCTSFLKVLVMFAYMEAQGLTDYTECVGLRADEPWRVLKMLGRNVYDGRKCVAPLSSAGITRRDVIAFWATQAFNLGLEPGEGNCDNCFMKGAKLRAALIRKRPWTGAWWAEKEVNGRFFDRRTRYATIVDDVARSPDLFSDADDEHDAECGLWCGAT